MISILKTTKGHNFANNLGRVTFLFSSNRGMMFYVGTKFCINVLNYFKIIEQTRFPN